MTNTQYQTWICNKFIGRKKYLKFMEESNMHSYVPVQMYFGIAGMGKTAISNELYKKYNQSNDNLVIKLDFSVQEHREKSHALNFLRYQLSSKYKVMLPAFELAYLHYWDKKNPNIPLLRGDIPYIEDADLMNDIVQNFYSFDEGTMKMVTELFTTATEELPLIKVIPKVIKLVSNIKGKHKDNRLKKKNNDLADTISKDAAIILEQLPQYFAKDLNEYLDKHPGKRCVILLDTYEELWNDARIWGSYTLKEGWLRDLIMATPRIQWIITGRDPLQWENEDRYWESRLYRKEVTGFNEVEGLEFLVESGIKDKEINKKIYEVSPIPEHLKLAAMKYHELWDMKKRNPSVSDFESIHNSHFQRIQNHLQKSEKHTLYALSATRYWNRDIFEFITRKFFTGLNIFDFQEFTSLSFVRNRSEFTEEWEIEKNVRKAAIEYLTLKDPYVWQRLQESYFYFYKQRYHEDIENFNNLSRIRKTVLEYMHHAKNFLKFDQLLQWFFDEIKDHVIEIGDLDLAITLFEELLDIIGPHKVPNNRELLVTATENLGQLYEQAGNRGLAEDFYKKSLELVTNYLDRMIIKTNLGTLLSSNTNQRNKIYEAELLFKENLSELISLDYAKEKNQVELYFRNKESLNEIEFIFASDESSKEKAIKDLQNIIEMKNDTGEDTFNCYERLGTWYISLKNKDPKKAIDGFKAALEILESSGEQSIENMEKKAVIFDKLAICYGSQKMRKYAEAKLLLEQSIKIFETSFPDQYIKSAQAKLHLGCLFGDLERFDKAYEIFDKNLSEIVETHPIYKETEGYYQLYRDKENAKGNKSKAINTKVPYNILNSNFSPK